MESIKSRPMPHVPFEYYFYVELVGDPAEAATAALLEELDRTCRTVRMLGVYTK
jgi:chorismate mutase/prephenate dehydratase